MVQLKIKENRILIPWSPLEHYMNGYQTCALPPHKSSSIMLMLGFQRYGYSFDNCCYEIYVPFTFTSWNLQMLSVYIGLFRNTNTFKYPLGSHILVVHGVIWQDRTGAGERSDVYLVFFIAQASAELRSFVVASLNHYRFTGSSCIFVLLA